jgi:hypothetical protein
MRIPACEVVSTALWAVDRGLGLPQQWYLDIDLLSATPQVREQAEADLKALWRFGYSTMRTLTEMADRVERFDMPLPNGKDAAFANAIMQLLREQYACHKNQARMTQAANYEKSFEVNYEAMTMLRECRHLREFGRRFQGSKVPWDMFPGARRNAYYTSGDDHTGKPRTVFVQSFGFAHHAVEATVGYMTAFLCEATDIFTTSRVRSAAGGKVCSEIQEAFNSLWRCGITAVRQTCEVALIDMKDFTQNGSNELELELLQYLLHTAEGYQSFRRTIQPLLVNTVQDADKSAKQAGGEGDYARSLQDLDPLITELHECQAMRHNGRKPPSQYPIL